ncbi:MAG: RHS repeat-associated core domain-containing protein, partial [Pseudomonadota bacterium]
MDHFPGGRPQYDGHNRRVKQVMGGDTIYSVYSLSGEMVYRHNVTAGERTGFIHMGGETVARVKNFWTPTYLHSDHLGSPSAATNTSGAISWYEDYTPYGEARQKPWSNDDQTGFTGHIHDDASGLTYMQARYYDPVIGRFLSSDPMTFTSMGGDPAYMNRYWYAGGDPVNAWDPNGELIANLVAGGIGGGIGAVVGG